jgi:hypothetical protein
MAEAHILGGVSVVLHWLLRDMERHYAPLASRQPAALSDSQRLWAMIAISLAVGMATLDCDNASSFDCNVHV